MNRLVLVDDDYDPADLHLRVWVDESESTPSEHYTDLTLVTP